MVRQSDFGTGLYTLVIAYDGSREARQALGQAIALVGGRAIVVYVWKQAPVAPVAPIAPGADLFPAVAPEQLAGNQTTLERFAHGVVDEGVALCRDAGLSADGLLLTGEGTGDTARAIVATAEEYDANLVVVGRRDRSTITTALLGSVSRDVVAHASCPVLVVPAGSGASVG